ncbi:hypothetical protein FRC03_008338 [Tulasnella sp. 419]|nr:hypothetical protein FRC02_009002 [Tulasnella sp. 418]KAG8968203.1 hypothetical protein FRC03_008338 [Tulasnella sp. 419]
MSNLAARNKASHDDYGFGPILWNGRKLQPPRHAPIFPKRAAVMAQIENGYWETGRVCSIEVIAYQDGTTGYRYFVSFIGDRMYSFVEEELGTPGDVIDRRVPGQGPL